MSVQTIAVIFIVTMVINAVSLAFIFKKAGKPIWAAFVPVLDVLTLHKITGSNSYLSLIFYGINFNIVKVIITMSVLISLSTAVGPKQTGNGIAKIEKGLDKKLKKDFIIKTNFKQAKYADSAKVNKEAKFGSVIESIEGYEGELDFEIEDINTEAQEAKEARAKGKRFRKQKRKRTIPEIKKVQKELGKLKAVMLEAKAEKFWERILLAILIINIVIFIFASMGIWTELAEDFGQDPLFGLAIAFLPFLLLPFLAFGPAKYRVWKGKAQVALS